MLCFARNDGGYSSARQEATPGAAVAQFSRRAGKPLCRRARSATVLRSNKKETTMYLGLRGRDAVVLGGTRGIGRVIAVTLAGEGAGIAVFPRNAAQGA